ncbi:unnamed protein product [Didymodactylos carnosus]|uniref:Uncharacterized protein n=2 Tax=Didymodactylos carnosus TaxID=1234261 RepID=A0A8S2CYJ2_9BILA|nr:unnamed protein product [Didymodactylos carnosus]CAF3550296.1 unnamed protein product [Didymodactylos carnosus]
MLLTVEIDGETDEDHERSAVKASAKSVLKTIRNLLKNTETFVIKLLTTSEKLSLKTTEKMTVKVVEKVTSKGTLKFVSKTAGKLSKTMPLINVAVGFGFGLWRIIDEPNEWESYLMAGGELFSGLISTIPGIGTYVSAATDAGLLAIDLMSSANQKQQDANMEEQNDDDIHTE